MVRNYKMFVFYIFSRLLVKMSHSGSWIGMEFCIFELFAEKLENIFVISLFANVYA